MSNINDSLENQFNNQNLNLSDKDEKQHEQTKK